MLANNLYAYGSNNPVNRFDPTGQWYIKAITSIINAAKQLIGFEYTRTITDSKDINLNINSSIVKAEAGKDKSGYVVKMGNSDKAISGYIKNNNNKFIDSSIGIKINVLKTSLTFDVGAKEISLNYGIKSKSNVINSTEFGIAPIDWSNIYFKVKSESSTEYGETSAYVKTSMSPLVPITAYVVTRAPSALIQLTSGYGLQQAISY